MGNRGTTWGESRKNNKDDTEDIVRKGKTGTKKGESGKSETGLWWETTTRKKRRKVKQREKGGG
jgi:hypothetical protein